jgi:hypothetical protein
MNPTSTSSEDNVDDDVLPDDDLADQLLDLESQKRLWVRALIPLLRMRSREADPSSRVQLALDLMHIAACERVRRLLRDDLADDQG